MPAGDGRFIVLGKIVDAYGLKGWVRVHPFADDSPGWQGLPVWWLRGDDGESESASWRPVDLRQCREQGRSLLASLAEVDDRDAALALRGLLVGAPRDALPKAAPDEYYWSDLTGLDVQNRQGENLGVVTELLESGAGSVLVVRDSGGVERLIPFIASAVVEVRLADGKIEVDWGLDW